MYITEFLNRLEVVPVEGDPEWAVRCDSPKLAGYAEGVIAALQNGEPNYTWQEGLFSVLANFAVHVLSYENCGLVLGASDAGKKCAIRLGNLEKEVEFNTIIKPKGASIDQLIDGLKWTLQRKRRLRKSVGLIAVHDIAANKLPLGFLPRSKADVLDVIFIFDGHKAAVERQVHRLKRRLYFVSANFHVREFSFEDQAPWTVAVYAHEATK